MGIFSKPSLENFEIHLNKQNATFAPGEVIEGKIFIYLRKVKNIRAVRIVFKGKCKVCWSESDKHKKGKHRPDYTGSEEYFRLHFHLFGHPGGETIKLFPGQHVFPFSFHLPQNIPSSFEHNIATVRYSMKAIIDRPWKFDHELKLPFTVDNPLILDQNFHTMYGIDDEMVSNYYCILPCISKGYIVCQLEIPTIGYSCGEDIIAFINIHNKSRFVEVQGIKLILEQRLTFHSKTPYKSTYHEKYVLEKSEKWNMYEDNMNVVIGVKIPPSLPHSNLEHCGLIDIEYFIRISVHVSSG